MRKLVMIALTAIMLFGCQSTVNTLENKENNAMPGDSTEHRHT
jgi:uncharacterized protein YcfL